MNNTGFTIGTVLFVALLAAGGYFAVSALGDPSTYVATDGERIGDVRTITSEPAGSAPVQTQAPAATPAAETKPAAAETPADPDAALIKKIEALVAAKVTLKVGSKGSQVGTVQEFMNRYLKTSTKIDNDFGKGLEANVKKFQAASGVTQTGQVASQTLSKMVEWLKKN